MPKLIPAVVQPGTMSAVEQPVLRVDDELELRPFHADDVGAVVAAFETPDIQYFHFRHLDRDEALRWIEECNDGWQWEKAATWAIVQRHEAQVLGRVTIHCSLVEGRGEVSYWVLPAGRRRRVATRACVAATRWAHGLGLHRVELQHSTTNEASRRVASNAGFHREGIRRAATVHADGRHDMVLYSHLATDDE